MMPAGRPSIFTQEIADAVCARLASGESLRRICLDADMPDRTTIWDWRAKFPEFANQYAYSRKAQAEVYFDEVIDISDETVGDPSEVQSAKLRADSRKWVLARMDRNLYGEKASLDLGSQPGNPLRTESTTLTIDPMTLPTEDQQALLRILHRNLQGAS
jgi:hypothetical protein